MTLAAHFRKRWSNAQPVTRHGIKHPSKLEARVYEELRLVAISTGARLYRHVRFPLLNLAPDAHGGASYFTPDFVLAGPGAELRVIDAKGRESPEWRRGALAFEAEYGIQVEVRRR